MRAAPSPLRRIEVGTAEQPLRLLAIQPIEKGCGASRIASILQSPRIEDQRLRIEGLTVDRQAHLRFSVATFCGLEQTALSKELVGRYFEVYDFSDGPSRSGGKALYFPIAS